MKFLKNFLFIFVFLAVYFLITPYSYAQNLSSGTGIGVAQMVQIITKTVKDGQIIANSDKGYTLATVPYDPQVIGVVARNAAIILNGNQGGTPVVSNGQVYILVSSQQGKIKKGDLIASSTIPGVGVKAVKAGYVMGTALEDYDNPNPKQTDLIAINLNLHYFNSKPTFPGTLSDIFKIAFLPTKDSPSPLFKDIVAALVLIGSFVLGFLTFGRTAAKGVEALGRNPAASKIIHLGIIFNVFIVGLIIAAGFTIAFLILRL
jgi:hypothetical protein